jgi:hypothetical protein
VLITCNACLRGCVVGDAHATEAIREQQCSAGLKLALATCCPASWQPLQRSAPRDAKSFRSHMLSVPLTRRMPRLWPSRLIL